MIKMVALILGGGRGTRLYPLTKDRSKPAVPIAGKYRLIDIPISNCLNSGLRRMFVLTQYNSASLNQHIKNTYHFDHFNHGFVDILAAEQTDKSPEWFQGTADAVRQSMHHLRNHDFDYILILSGDQLYQMDFEKLANYHIDKDADLTIATIPVNDDDATGFGIMKVDRNGFIKSFVEKPAKEELRSWKSPVTREYSETGKHYLASMGIYMFKARMLKRLFDENPNATDFGKEIIPHAIKEGYRISSYQYSGYWTDIGTIDSFFEANIELTSNLPKFNVFDNNNTVYTRPRLLAPSKVFGTRFNKAIIAEGCIIHADRIEHSVIGIRSRIGDGSVLREVITMGNDRYETLEQVVLAHDEPHMGVGRNCHIERAILDKDCRVGNDVVIRGHHTLEDSDHEAYMIRDGIVVVKKGCTIPAGAKIGYLKDEQAESENRAQSNGTAKEQKKA